jgi:hypothetical protein
MSARFCVIYKERDWDWDKSPCQYCHTLEEANDVAWGIVKTGGRFKVLRIYEDRGGWDLIDEIDVDALKDSN